MGLGQSWAPRAESVELDLTHECLRVGAGAVLGEMGFEQGLVLGEPGQEQTQRGLWDVPKPPGSSLAACTHPSVPKEEGDPCQEHLTPQSPSLPTTQVLLQLTKFPFPSLGGIFFAMPSEQTLPTSPTAPPVAALQVPAPGTPAGPATAQLGQRASRTGGNLF